MWQCPITRMWRFWFIGRTCSPSTATRHHPEPGMSLRRWPSGSRPGSGQKGRKIFGDLSGPARSQSESEALIGEGLEWQAAEGGGHIIEPDGRISVNNQDVVRAWERAAHWVGWISPPSVVSYTTSDAENIFWVSGTAAFQLEWALTYEVGVLDKPFRDKVGVTSLPAGKSARVADVGAYSLGISRTSAHRAEAVQLIQFLIRKQAQSRAAPHVETSGRKAEYFEVPLVMKHIYPWWCKPGDTAGSTVVLRPSTVAGSKYEAVSKAYSQALHSVLTRAVHSAGCGGGSREVSSFRLWVSDRAQPVAGSH